MLNTNINVDVRRKNVLQYLCRDENVNRKEKKMLFSFLFYARIEDVLILFRYNANDPSYSCSVRQRTGEIGVFDFRETTQEVIL